MGSARLTTILAAALAVFGIVFIASAAIGQDKRVAGTTMRHGLTHDRAPPCRVLDASGLPGRPAADPQMLGNEDQDRLTRSECSLGVGFGCFDKLIRVPAFDGPSGQFGEVKGLQAVLKTDVDPLG